MDQDKRDATQLDIILLLIDRIGAHLSRTTLDHFVDNPDDVDLLAYRLAMIGEATNRLSPPFKDRFPEMPWSSMYRLRNIVAHQYQNVTPQRLWATAASDLDALGTLCREELIRIGE